MKLEGALLVAMVIAFHGSVVGALGWGVRGVVRRSGLPKAGAIAVYGAFVLWLVVVFVIGARGGFEGQADRLQWAEPTAVLVSVALGALALRAWRPARALLDATPLHWLCAMQLYRTGGSIFLLMLLQGDMPAAFSVPVGIIDIASGSTGFLLSRRGSG